MNSSDHFGESEVRKSLEEWARARAGREAQQQQWKASDAQRRFLYEGMRKYGVTQQQRNLQPIPPDFNPIDVMKLDREWAMEFLKDVGHGVDEHEKGKIDFEF